MSIEFIITLILFGIVFLNQVILARRLAATDHNALLALKGVQAARRMLVVDRQSQPDSRPTIRNRELTALGRDIDAEVPVSEDIEIVGG